MQARFTAYFSHIFNNEDLNHFYVATMMRMFAISMFSLFIPALLWTNGVDLRGIALFIGLWYFTHSMLTIIVGKLLIRFHARYFFMLSHFLNIVFFYYINHIDLKLLPLIAVMMGVAGVCFWVPYHSYFCQKADSKSRGRKLGAFVFMSGLLMMIAPVIGGFFLEHAGSQWLIIMVGVMLLGSLVPMWSVKKQQVTQLSAKNVWKLIFSKEGLALSAHGFVAAPSWTFWPLFLFILFEGFFSLGMVSFFTSLFALIMTLIFGSIVDQIGHVRVLRKVGFMKSLLWVARIFAIVPINAIIVDAIDKSVAKVYYLAFDARTYELGRKPEHIVAREVGINMGGAVFMIIITIFPFFGLVYALAAIGALWAMTL